MADATAYRLPCRFARSIPQPFRFAQPRSENTDTAKVVPDALARDGRAIRGRLGVGSQELIGEFREYYSVEEKRTVICDLRGSHSITLCESCLVVLAVGPELVV